MASNTSPIVVGILLLPPVQLLDAAPVDLLGMLTPGYMRAVDVSDELAAQALEFEFHYIAESGIGSHVEMTGGVKYLVTVSRVFFSSHNDSEKATMPRTPSRALATLTYSLFPDLTLHSQIHLRL